MIYLKMPDGRELEVSKCAEYLWVTVAKGIEIGHLIGTDKIKTDDTWR
jgi:hypothetical protein